MAIRFSILCYSFSLIMFKVDKNMTILLLGSSSSHCFSTLSDPTPAMEIKLIPVALDAADMVVVVDVPCCLVVAGGMVLSLFGGRVVEEGEVEFPCASVKRK